MNEKRFAVLFDGDNNNKECVKKAIEKTLNEGVITYKRMYADWTNTQMQGMKDVLLEYSITPMQQYSYTTGKNATDSAMIIDAMDILYAGQVDGFCLVSSDSDFTRLAARLREAGMLVIGMGRKQTPKAFVSACNKFEYLDGKEKEKSAEENFMTPLKEIKNALKEIIEEQGDEEGWALVVSVSNILRKRYPEYSYKNYGETKESEFLKKCGFEVEKRKHPNQKTRNLYDIFVRIKK